MQKKLLSILLVLCMLLSMFPAVLPVSAEETDTEAVEDTAAVVEVGDADTLKAIMSDSEKWSGSYKLTDDIDLTGLVETGMGTEEVNFTGTFDGDGHTVTLALSGAGRLGFINYAGGNALVKNLTIKGSVASTGDMAGAFVGEIKGDVTLENLTNYAAVSGIRFVGGITGGINVGIDASVTARNCVNRGTVTGSEASCYVGGIAGGILSNIDGNVFVIDGCINRGKISGVQMVGGIVGRYDIGSANKTAGNEIKNCANYGSIETTTGRYTGGIIGIFTIGSVGQTDSCSIDVYNCYNAGNITSANKYNGGIAGYFRAYAANKVALSNVMNSGKVTSTQAAAANGGIAGVGNGSMAAFTVSNVYNCGSVTTGDYTSVGPVSAAWGTHANVSGTYYLDLGETYTSTTDTKVTTDNYSSAATFPQFSADYWMFTSNGPELLTFHEHKYDDGEYVASGDGHILTYTCYCGDSYTEGEVEGHQIEDGTCTVCGVSEDACKHATTKDVITLAPTCRATGYKNVVCATCETVLEKDIVVEKDSTNHEDGLSIVYNAVECSIDYVRDCCGDVEYSDYTYGTEVYVSASGITLDENVVVEDDIGLDESTAFASVYDAVDYLAASLAIYESEGDEIDGVTLHIVDSVTISTNLTTPETDVMLTVTGGEIKYASSDKVIYLGGPATFKDTTLTATGASYIIAQNNKVVIDTGVKTNSNSASANKMYLIGGKNSTAVDGTIAGDITVRSGAWHLIAGGNRFSTVASKGSVKMTLGTKSANDTLVINQITPYGTNGGDLGADAYATIIVDGAVDITKLYASIYPSSTYVGAHYTYNVDLVLKQGADITTLTGLTNQATSAKTVWTVYADQRDENAKADATLFANMGENVTVTQSTYVKYCAAKLNHVDKNNDKYCDECGGSTECAHDNVSEVIVTASTCKTAGTVNYVCDCGSTVDTGTLELDKTNHENDNHVWSKNGETGAYELVCSGCGVALISQEEAPTVYVAKYDAGVTSGDDANDGLTSATGVATIEEAVKRLANVGGTVLFTARYDMNGADIHLPAYSEKITFSGVIDSSGNATTGFINTGAEGRLYLAGPTAFNNIVFKGATQNVIVGNWNDVDFDYVRVHDEALIYFVAGGYLITESDDTVKDITINIDGATMSTSAATQSGTSETIFYSRVYLGDVFGANELTVSNKKVTLNVEKGKFHEATIDVLYTMSTTGNKSYAASTTENCETVVNLNDGTSVARGRSGDYNVGYNDVSKGSLDKLILNFYDNSTISGEYYIRNVENTVINISKEVDGRTTKIAKQFIFFKYGTFTENTTATATVNCDSHSYSVAKIARVSTADGVYDDGNDENDYKLTINEENVCDYKGEVTTTATPDSAGVMTYTCTSCGRTYTEEIPYECTAHAYVVKADGTYYCANNCGTVEAPTAPVIVAAAPATAENGTVKVTVSAKATTPIVGAEFTVNAPEGFTLTAFETEYEEAGENTTGLTVVGGDTVAVPYGIALVNLSAEDVTIDTEILTLTFAVAETVENGEYVITIESAEAYNLAEEAVESVAVSAEVTVGETVEHTHEYTDWTDDGNGNHVGTCSCGDTSTEPHGELTEIAKAVAPTCTEAGKTAVMGCTKCTYTEGGKVDPATGHNHVKGDLVPATRTTDAYYTYTCSCGDSYTQDVKGEYETDVEFKHSVDLESEYIFNFKVTKTTVSDTYDDQWFEITKYPYVNGVATPTTHIVEASDRDTQWEGRAPAIAAKEMNDKMEAVFCQIVDGVKYTSQVDICNLVGYYQLASGANAPVAAVIAEMMNYGAAAQIMFSYNTTTVEGDDNTGLINRHIDTSKHTIKSSLEDYSDVILSANRVKYEDTEGMAYTVKSNSALLESKINLVMKYNIIPEYADDLDVDTLVYRGTYTTVTGESMTIEVSGDKFDDSSSTTLIVDLDQIAVKDLRQTITGAIYDANGNRVSETCETSFECYAKAANDAETEEINKHLAKAVISFCDAAIDHFS